MTRHIPYGIMNYAELIRKNQYFIDKTSFIGKLEQIKNPVFLRPRRFGKSLFCSMLQYYYDLREAHRFEELFSDTWIGQNPTEDHNRFIVLKLDFSCIQPESGIKKIEISFNKHCNSRFNTISRLYPEFLSGVSFNIKDAASDSLNIFLEHLIGSSGPPVFVIIDEYDNFANHLITTHQDQLYQEITTGESFLRTFFKVLKAGRQTGAVENIFITGVFPITIDDLTSAYNIPTFITLDSTFEGMLGFYQSEVDHLLDNIYHDYAIDPATRLQVDELIKNYYNGYHFVNSSSEPIYNSTMLMFFLRHFCEHRTIPNELIDLNLRSDLSWIKRLTGGCLENTEEFISQLMTQDTVPYSRKTLVSEFNKNELFEQIFYPVSLFYLGMLTKHNEFLLKLPNLSMKEIVVEYFNELFRIDLGTNKYEDIMQGFVNDPDLSLLFTGYWERYVSQLPEAIFSKVNENFYRTTFFELCSRYLSSWFTWNLERSYPEGRSDLEFVGKYHERFANFRWVIEFKYLSNKEFNRLKIPIEDLQIQNEDSTQIRGYARGLIKEYPEARIRLFVIYCIGNLGFRVFEVSRG